MTLTRLGLAWVLSLLALALVVCLALRAMGGRP